MRWIMALALLLAVPARAQDLAGHGGPVRALAVLEGGGLASAGFDQAVILWDPVAGLARAVARWHQGAVAALAATPGGGVASGGEDGRIALWPPGGLGRPVQVIEAGAPIAGLAAMPRGGIAAALWDGTVRAWDAAGALAWVGAGHAGPVAAVAVGSGGTVMSAGFDGTVRSWDAAGQGSVLGAFGLPQAALVGLPGGGIATGGADGVVRLLAPDGTVTELAAGDRPVIALAVDPGGRRLAVAGIGGTVALWALPEARLVRLLEGPGLPVWSVAFAADGETLWTGGADRVVRRWRAASGVALGPLAPVEVAVPIAGDAAGARVFRACAACHGLTEAAGAMLAGPHLHGLFGRRMGSVPGYPYSPRLAQRDVVWTEATVGALFTLGPDAMLPGTTMPVQRVAEPDDLAALLRFLAAATR